MIYLDNQATTPLAPEALEAMMPWLSGPETMGFANPTSPHRPGRAAAAIIEHARDQVHSLLPAGGRVIFTSGATEAISLGLLSIKQGTAAVSAIEHSAVTASAMARELDVQVIPVDAKGLVDSETQFAHGTGVVAVMQVNNEIGTVQPVERLADRAHEAGALFFCDAVAAAGKLAPPDNADMIALTAHKLYGPKGVGALWVRDGLEIPPLNHGGGQEGGSRPGTLSPALCAGFGAAAALAKTRMELDFQHLQGLASAARGILHRWTLNGSESQRWPGNLNLRLTGLDVGRLMSDLRQVAFSTGSACSSGSGKPSFVISALGVSDRDARTSIRLGFGRYTTMEDVEDACAQIEAAAAAQGV